MIRFITLFAIIAGGHFACQDQKQLERFRDPAKIKQQRNNAEQIYCKCPNCTKYFK